MFNIFWVHVLNRKESVCQFKPRSDKFQKWTIYIKGMSSLKTSYTHFLYTSFAKAQINIHFYARFR